MGAAAQKRIEPIEQWEEIPIAEVTVLDNASREAPPTEAEIEATAQTIRQVGLLHPIVVERRATGGYLLNAGETRLRGAERAGMEKIPAKVQPPGTAARRALINLTENLSRKAPSEFRITLEVFALYQGGVPIEVIARSVRETTQWVRCRIKIAERVPKDILDELRRDESESMLRDLSRCAEMADMQAPREERETLQREWWVQRNEPGAPEPKKPQSRKKFLADRLVRLKEIAPKAQEAFDGDGWFVLSARERRFLCALVEWFQSKSGPAPVR
jgi:ParB-like chromosome segregation protein Spo0J